MTLLYRSASAELDEVAQIRRVVGTKVGTRPAKISSKIPNGNRATLSVPTAR
jgi:hypothetical protein